MAGIRSRLVGTSHDLPVTGSGGRVRFHSSGLQIFCGSAFNTVMTYLLIIFTVGADVPRLAVLSHLREFVQRMSFKSQF